MSKYEFSLQQEVLMEKGAAVLADLLWYEQAQRLLGEDNPVCILYGLVWQAKRRILSAKAEADLVQIEAQFDLAKDFLSRMEVAAHA